MTEAEKAAEYERLIDLYLEAETILPNGRLGIDAMAVLLNNLDMRGRYNDMVRAVVNYLTAIDGGLPAQTVKELELIMRKELARA